MSNPPTPDEFEPCPGGYNSPRWSGEVLDCSMPMTFDTYSQCSYNCGYCFAANQKLLGESRKNYLANRVRSVHPEQMKALFRGTLGRASQFDTYIAQRKAMQWGGMSDPFDEHERRYGVTLDLIRFFREIEYPICFSTKATWWTEDPRYREVFQGAHHFNVKFSIITLDEHKAHLAEAGTPTPAERLAAIERLAHLDAGGATLRLRPFIIGITDPHHVPLIHAAADAGATAVSTEFFCLERRNPFIHQRLKPLNKAAGFDMLRFYIAQTPVASGYMRLNRELKRPFIDEMEQACRDTGLRFYVSDAHFKERCANGSCCGLSADWNYCRGQFTEAIVHARAHGSVRWSDLAPLTTHLDWCMQADRGSHFNKGSSENAARFHGWTYDRIMRWYWNNPNSAKSPYLYFGGVLVPDGKDEAGDVIYRYVGD